MSALASFQDTQQYEALDIFGARDNFDGFIPVQNTYIKPGLEPVDIITRDGESLIVVTVIRSLADPVAKVTMAEQANNHSNNLARDVSLARFQRYGVKEEHFLRGRELTITEDHYQLGKGAEMEKKIYICVTRIPKEHEKRFIAENKEKMDHFKSDETMQTRARTSLERNYPQLYHDISATLKRAEEGITVEQTGEVFKGSAVYGVGFVNGFSKHSETPKKTVNLSDVERDIGIKLAELISSCETFEDFHLGPLESTFVQNPYGIQQNLPRVINIFVDGKTENKVVKRDQLWDEANNRFKLKIPNEAKFAKTFNEFLHHQQVASHGYATAPIDGKGGDDRTIIRAIEVAQLIETPWYPPKDKDLFTRGDNILNTMMARANARIDNPHQKFEEIIPMTMELDIVDIKNKLSLPEGVTPRRFAIFERATVANTPKNAAIERGIEDKFIRLGLDRNPYSLGVGSTEKDSRDLGNAQSMRLGIPGALGKANYFVHTNIPVSPSEQRLSITVARGNYFLCERLVDIFRSNPDFKSEQMLGNFTDVPFTVFGPNTSPFYRWRAHFYVVGTDVAIKEGRKECPIKIETASTPGSGMQFGVVESIFVKNRKERDNYRFHFERDLTTVREIEYKGKKRLFWLWDVARWRSVYPEILEGFYQQSNAGRIGFKNRGVVTPVNAVTPGRDNEGTGPGLFGITMLAESNHDNLLALKGKKVVKRSRAFNRNFPTFSLVLRSHIGGPVRKTDQTDEGFYFTFTKICVDDDTQNTNPTPVEEVKTLDAAIMPTSKIISSRRFSQGDTPTLKERLQSHMDELTATDSINTVRSLLGLAASSSNSVIQSKLEERIRKVEVSWNRALNGTVDNMQEAMKLNDELIRLKGMRKFLP